MNTGLAAHIIWCPKKMRAFVVGTTGYVCFALKNNPRQTALFAHRSERGWALYDSLWQYAKNIDTNIRTRLWDEPKDPVELKRQAIAAVKVMIREKKIK